MAYLTKLKNNDIKEICFNYNIKYYNKFIPVYEGIQNSNYIIYSKKKYLLTIYEDKDVLRNLTKYLKLMIYLGNNNIPCPIPLKNINNNIISNYINKKYSIFNFLNGKHLNKHFLYQYLDLGEHLAKIHFTTKTYPIKINNNFNIKFYSSIINKYGNIINKYNKDLSKKFKYTVQEYKKIKKYNLPEGLIHADLFPDNVLFYKRKISGLLDFYYACNNYLICDLSIVIISWCFQKNTEPVKLNTNKIKNILRGYNNIRRITKKELNVLNLVNKIYCIRFFLTRLIDMDKNLNSKYIQTKNPLEYFNKFLYFDRNNINYEELLNND